MSEPSSCGFTVIPHRTLSLGDEIGKGRFKSVHKAVLQRRPVVVLKYPMDSIAASGSVNLSTCAQNEIDIFRRLSEHGQHQHIPEIYGLCQKKDALWLAQEMSSFGALRDVLLDDNTSQLMTVTHKMHASVQMADAMTFLKKNRIIHADLSCRNVLLFRLESEPALTTVKLVDFGLALTLPEFSDSVNHKQPRAVRWCSPETVRDSCLSYRSDAWSLGATLWELFSDGLTPWSNLKKRSDVTERLCALMDKSVRFDAVTEFPRPIGCPVVMHRVILSVLRLTEHDRASVEDLQNLFTKVLRGEKICMSSEVGRQESEAVLIECAGKSLECARKIDADSCESKKDESTAKSLESTAVVDVDSCEEDESAAKALECTGDVDADSCTKDERAAKDLECMGNVDGDSCVVHDASATASFECAVKVDVDGEVTEQIFASIQTLENSIDDFCEQSDSLVGDVEEFSEQSESLAGDVEDFENYEDTDMTPMVRRKSLLNQKTGEEEYFHPDDDDSGVVEVKGDIHNFRISVGENEDSSRMDAERCLDGNLQPQYSLMSTAATSEADSGASTPRTPPSTECIKPKFQCPVRVESIVRCSPSTEVPRSSIFGQPTAGGGVRHVPLPGTQASSTGKAFCDAQDFSNLPEQSRRIPLVQGNSKPPLLLRSSTPALFRSCTPTVLLRPVRSQSVMQERSVVHNPCAVNQMSENSWQCAINAQRTMPQASGCCTVFSVPSGRSMSPMRLSCPSRFA